jgi:hypothetical protein
MTSPELTDGLRDMHEKMAIKQITALEKRVKELEGENMRLKEQVRRGCVCQSLGGYVLDLQCTSMVVCFLKLI